MVLPVPGTPLIHKKAGLSAAVHSRYSLRARTQSQVDGSLSPAYKLLVAHSLSRHLWYDLRLTATETKQD